jgi:hypothetical protein
MSKLVGSEEMSKLLVWEMLKLLLGREEVEEELEETVEKEERIGLAHPPPGLVRIVAPTRWVLLQWLPLEQLFRTPLLPP